MIVKNKKFTVLLLFVVFSFAIYLPLLFTKLYWDDTSLLFNQINQYQLNLNVFKFFGLNKESYSWPIFYLFFSILVKFFGKHYLYYRLFMLFIHGLNAYLFWKILKKFKFKNSLLLSLIFLVHPYHLLTLSLIIQIKTLMAVFFLLLSINYFFNFYNFKNQFLSVSFYVLSILSKSITLSFFPFYLYFYFKRKKSQKNIIPLLILISLSGFSALRTMWDATSQSFIHQNTLFNWYNSSSIFYRFLISIKNFNKYFFHGFFPIRVNYLYQPSTEIEKTFLEYFVVIIPLLISIHFFLKICENQKAKYKFFYLFYSINIIPLCGLFFIPIFATSNFITYWYYLPLLGLIPLMTFLFKNNKIYFALIIIFSLYTHLYAYSYIKTENVIINSMKATPNSVNLKLALLDYYYYAHQCSDYSQFYREVFDGTIIDKDNQLKEIYLKKLKLCRANHE